MRERVHAAGRRDEVALDVRGKGGNSPFGKGDKKRARTTLDVVSLVSQAIGLTVAILVIVGVGATLFQGRSNLMSSPRTKARAEDSDAMVLRRATEEMKEWHKTGELPTFGLSRGDYKHNDKFCSFCGGDLEWCKAANVSNTTTPPVELLLPGRLVTRRITEKGACFMWYMEALYSRPSGGKDGIYLQRIGGVDSKRGLIEAFQKYEAQHKCKPFQVYPISLDLSKSENCEAFRTGYFEDPLKLKDILWFVKASNGSTGNHIQLVRGDVAAHAGSATAKCTGDCRTKVECPAPELIASMNVRDIWTLGNKKFDNRAYLLIASVDPLVVFYRMGHLRLGMLDYKGSDDLDFNVHVTNPRFAHNITNDTSQFIKKYDTLREDLVQQYGEAEGTHRFNKVGQSVMNAMLTVVYSVKSVWEHKELWKDDRRVRLHNLTWSQLSGNGYSLRWSFGFLALDIGMDVHGNAFVLDVNTGPSFYHKMDLEWWFRVERSMMAREAFDILQEVSFKKVYARAHNKTAFSVLRDLKTPSHWLPLYNQPAGGAAVGPLKTKLVEIGECAQTYDSQTAED